MFCTDLQNEFMVAGGGWWGDGRIREFGLGMYTLLYLEWITNTHLLYTAQGTLLNVMWQPGWDRSLGWNGYMYMYDSPFTVRLKLSQHG